MLGFAFQQSQKVRTGAQTNTHSVAKRTGSRQPDLSKDHPSCLNYVVAQVLGSLANPFHLNPNRLWFNRQYSKRRNPVRISVDEEV